MPDVLAVDDNAANLELTRAVMESEGWQVHTACDAEEALEAARRLGAVDVVLLDIQMPGRSGLEVLPELRKVLPGVPVIALTAYATREDRSRFLRAGFDHHIAKPIHVATFASEVLQVIGRMTDSRRPHARGTGLQPRR